MEKLYVEDKYFESRNSELENEHETQDLYQKLKTLEEREWIYQDYINELAKREASCRDELEESLVKLGCREKMNDALENKLHEERFTYAKLVSRTLQQVESGIMELEEANKKLAGVKRELGEANSYLRVAELKLQFANEKVTRRESNVNDLKNSLCIYKELANAASAKNDEIIRLTRIVGELQINNKILEKEKFMLTQELASKIKESQELEDTKLQSETKEKELQEELASKKELQEELAYTKLQSQIKEKELQEELEVALCEKKIFFELLRFKLQEKEFAHRKKKTTKRAERATCIKSIVALIFVALIFAFITVIYLWGKKY